MQDPYPPSEHKYACTRLCARFVLLQISAVYHFILGLYDKYASKQFQESNPWSQASKDLLLKSVSQCSTHLLLCAVVLKSRLSGKN